MYIIQVRSIREGRVCWEDYHSENDIDDVKHEFRKYKETFGKNKVRIVKELN